MDRYCLGTSYSSTVGLNLQHSLVRKVLNEQLLEPNIPYKQGNLTIADIPCGTCMWLIDLASQVDPSTKLEGFDLNLGQGPPPAWLPENVHISGLDLFEPPPPELCGKFDIVHVSLVVCFVKDENVADVVKNIMSLLKPGGHLQWLEMVISDTKFECATPDYVPKALPQAVENIWKMIGWTSHQWPQDIPALLTTAGFTEVQGREPPISRTLGRAFADGELLGMLPILMTAQAERPELGLKVEEVQDMVKQAWFEVSEKGVGCFPRILVNTARRPLKEN